MDLQSSEYCLCMKSPMAAWMSARVPLFSLSALTAAFLILEGGEFGLLDRSRACSRILQHSASQANISVCHTRHHPLPVENLPSYGASLRIWPNVQPRPPELSSYTSSSSQPANAASSPRNGSDSASPPASSSESSVLIRGLEGRSIPRRSRRAHQRGVILLLLLILLLILILLLLLLALGLGHV